MSEAIEVECGLCGRNGEPPAGCETCHGSAETVPRAYTLSEIKAGVAPQSEDRFESLNPKPSPLVVGGAINHPTHPEKQV